jgi:hypothetical protein
VTQEQLVHKVYQESSQAKVPPVLQDYRDQSVHEAKMENKEPLVYRVHRV